MVTVALCAAACTHTENQSSDQGRGSAACHAWQDAVCDYAADRCGAMTRSECDSQYQAVTCQSDDAARSCADDFNTSRCGRASASCDLDAIADPAPATRACDDLVQHFCARSVSCGASETQDACLATPTVKGIDCGKAIAYRLAYEQCFQQVDTLDCTVLELPPICSDVIILRT
jgi:hypothetical protein